MSKAVFVSSGTRFVAAEWNATTAPSPEIAGLSERSLACSPAAPRDTRTVVPAIVLRTKMSSLALVSPATRLADEEVKATIVPLDESDGSELRPVPWAPALE